MIQMLSDHHFRIQITSYVSVSIWIISYNSISYYPKSIALLKALMDFYSLTIFTYNRTRKKFDSKFIFMIVLTTLTAMTTKQFNLVLFCRSSLCTHSHTVQKIYYIPIAFLLYPLNRIRNNIWNQDINQREPEIQLLHYPHISIRGNVLCYAL